MVLNPDTQLLPKALVETVRSAPAGVFRRAFDGVLLLVVRVHSLDSPLTQGLQATNGGVVRTGFGLATEELPRIDLTEPPADPADGVDAARFLPLLSGMTDSVHFVVALRKLAGGGGRGERVHVGRAPDNDVVLSDPTVSATHAWFDRDREGTLRLSDAGSRNGTRVNDRALVGGERRFIQPMDRIELGAVAAFICEPTVLRGVLRLGAFHRTG